MQFHYEIYLQRTGKTEHGTLDAASEREAEQLLWQQDCVILTLEEATARPQSKPGSSLSIYTLMPTFFGVRPAQITLFTRQLAALLGSGVGLLQALNVLAQQAQGALRPVLSGVMRDIQSGLPLSQAAANQSTAFPDFYARMLRVGERSGNLEVVLRQIALYMQKEQSVTGRVQRAMAYPLFLLAASLAVVSVILTFALPALTTLYAQFKADLPLPTRILVAITGFAQSNGLLLLLLLALFVLLAILFAQTDSGRVRIDGALLRLPLLGAVNVRSIVARYTRTLGLLLRAGIPLVEIMDLVEATVGNRVARRALASVRRDVMRGQSFSAALAAQTLFPPMLAQMVQVGEETGKLEANLELVADLYEEEVDRAISALTGALEPAMTIIMGLIVGFIAVSTILPIYSIMRQIR
jgi:type IV pilus assembly protein PilC